MTAYNSFFAKYVDMQADHVIRADYGAYHTLVVRRERGRSLGTRGHRNPAVVETYGTGGGRYAWVELGIRELREVAAACTSMADELEAEAAEDAETAADWADLPTGYPA